MIICVRINAGTILHLRCGVQENGWDRAGLYAGETVRSAGLFRQADSNDNKKGISVQE